MNTMPSCITNVLRTSETCSQHVFIVYSMASRQQNFHERSDLVTSEHRNQSIETAWKPWVEGVATSQQLFPESSVGTDLLLMRVIHCVSRGPDLCSCWELLAGGFKVGFGLICRTQALYCAGLSMTAVIGDSDVSHHLGHQSTTTRMRRQHILPTWLQ